MTEVTPLHFGILGPLQVAGDSGPIRVTAPRERAVLALLLLRHDQLVPVGDIIDAIWQELPPPTVRDQVKTAISTLRRLLGDAGRPPGEQILMTRHPGYLLRTSPDGFDLTRFESLVAAAETDEASGMREEAANQLRSALELWRGPALTDVTAPFAASAARNLALRKLDAAERLVELELARGRDRSLVSMLRSLIQDHPLHERLRARLMLVLYRTGQIDAALEAFRAARHTFAEELGIEPGPELVQLHRSILRREPEVGAESTLDDLPPVPRQLPRRPAALVGRERLFEEMTQAISGLGSPVVALHGPGGVGKSALALWIGHELAAGYPDGQLYIDLQGTAPGRQALSSGEVLGRFLRALGTPAKDIPASVQEAATLYQSLLNQKRVQILLDNAIDAAQVAPLLPAEPGCAVIITSRAILSTLDSEMWSVSALDPADAVRMLSLAAGQDRIAREPAAADEIAELCGRLPLALRIAGARLASRPDWSLEDLLTRLRDERRRLDELRASDLAVRPCLEVGVAALGPGAPAQAFRLFGTFSIPQMSVAVMAALLDTDAAEAEQVLDRLVEARLIEPAGHGRFGCHNLLRLYAAELAEREDPPRQRAEALRRGLDWYLAACRQVHDLFRPLTHDRVRPPAVLGPVDTPAALAWFDEEVPNLVAMAALLSTADAELATRQNELPLRDLLQKRGYWAELEVLGRLGLQAAQRAGNVAHQAVALLALGNVAWRAGRSAEAQDFFRESRRCWREVDDTEGALRAWHHIAWSMLRMNDNSGALIELEAAARLIDERSPRGLSGSILHNLAEALMRLGRHAEAARRFEEVLLIRREIGDRIGESVTLISLALAYTLLDERGRALGVVTEALVACERAGNVDDRFHALVTRSELHRRQGDFGPALADATAAHELTTDINDRYGQAISAWQLSRVHAETGARDEAAIFAAQAKQLLDDDHPRDPSLERILDLSD